MVLSDGYPRAYFFRSSEGFAANERLSFDRWEAGFSRLMGIEGKVLEEEIPGRSRRNIDFFTRLKRRHPRQLVLLHYNGNARDPRYQTQDRYFAGHWIYYNGAKILSDVPAADGETEIHVSDPSLFCVDTGRYWDKNEDIGLCSVDGDGKPDWHNSEQVQLLSVAPQRKTITVRRGCYGTTPRAFAAKASYAAAHVHEGPWGRRSNLMWFYNYATRCPRDANGKTCADVHVAELATRFAPDGELAAFDGIQFDVLHNHCGRMTRQRGPDCDADGQPDGGVFDGINQYGAGVVEFCRELRKRLGEDTLVLADGHGPHHQRAFGLLNGIESEGWPALSDWEIRDWSGGLNRHFFWRANARPPVFNYVNHKFTMAGENPGQRVLPDVPWSTHRLVFAASVLTDSAICYSFTPPKRPGELIGIWDELVKGTENQTAWLGAPLGPAVRLATESPNLVGHDDEPPLKALITRVCGDGVKIELNQASVKVASTHPEARHVKFRVENLPCDGPDLFLSLTARGDTMKGYPPEMARLAWVGIAEPDSLFVRQAMPTTGMCLRGGEESELVPQSGASVRWQPRCSLGGSTAAAYMVHPPYRDATGYTFWSRDLLVPPVAHLEFLTGMGEKAPGRSDGVVFQVCIATIDQEGVGEFREVFEHRQVESRWSAHRVDLREYDGKRVRFKFISDCGPQDNSTTDHSYWGNVFVVEAGGRRNWTTPVRHMTWVNRQSFGSNFYFCDVKSKEVDIEVVVEGNEPVWLETLTAHAHPDIVLREFEYGLVLANPSPRPCTFDLRRRFPGKSFRRLHGTANQDPVTNNGQLVEGPLQLSPRDALFLVREQPRQDRKNQLLLPGGGRRWPKAE